jgi:hypothetical protein
MSRHAPDETVPTRLTRISGSPGLVFGAGALSVLIGTSLVKLIFPQR